MKRDVVVLGATGFTGQLVVATLANISPRITWLITARSKDKLAKLVEHVNSKGVDISDVPTLEVDTTNQTSLTAALSQATVALNCVGPNTERSEEIVQACITCKTHYIDISAEINHIFNLHMKYHKAAEEANVLVLPACAFSSLVPASGLLYLQQQFQGTLNSAECYFELDIPKRMYVPLGGHTLASGGTWRSLVHVLTNMREYQRLRREGNCVVDLPQDVKRGFFHCRHKKLWFPYPGADQDVIEMSERYLQEKTRKRPVHFKLYCAMPFFLHYIIIPFMFLYYYLSFFKCFAKLLWKFPRVFTLGYMSDKGPSEKTRDSTLYNFTYIGKGWDSTTQDFSKPPHKIVKVKLSSKDPYKTTALVMVISAITLLKEQSQMPSGGVINVGAAFNETTLVERLMNNGIKYEVVPKT